MEKTQALVNEFAATLETLIVERINQRLRDVLAIGLVQAPEKERAAVRRPVKSRRKGPIQLCPAPGCKGRAAPVFGMLCTKHKDASKRTVKQWREARRARKQGK